MKKRFLSAALAMAMVSGLTACGGSSQPAATTAAATTAASGETKAETQAETTAPSGEKKTLTVTFKDDGQGENHPWYVWIKNTYENWELKDQYDLNIAPITGSESDYYTKVALQLADANTCPDVVFEDTFQLPSDVSAGYLTNLDSYLTDYEDWNNGTYYDSMKKGSIAADGSVYGVPFCTDTRGIWYNKEIFKKAGLPEDWQPENWQDILNACAAVKANVPDVIPFWCNSGVATGEATSMQTYEMLLYGTGEKLVDEDGKWIVKSQAIQDTLQFISDIYTNGYGPSLSLVLNGQATNTARREYLPQQKLAMHMDGGWISANWTETGAAPWADYQKIMGFAAMPKQNGGGTVTMSGGWTLSIPEKTSEKDAAFSFIKQMMVPPVYTQSVIAQGNIVTRADAAQDEEYNAQPFKKEATALLDGAFFRPQNEQYSVVTTSIQTMVESVVSGNTPEEAMKQYALDVARIAGDDNVVEK
jgi:multiple sugar transport system substrate-binding protein